MNRTLLSVLIYGFVIAGLAMLNGALIAMALPALVLLAAGLYDAPETPRLRAERHVSPDRASQGQPIAVRLVVTNEGGPLHELLLEDRLPRGLALEEGSPALLTTLAPGETAEISYTVRGRRGLHTFPDLRATARDRLGLFSRSAAVPAPGQAFVLPDLFKIRQVTIRPRRTKVYSGQIPARQGGPGVEFFGVREYQPGDPTRWINARASARHAEALFVNEFEQERVADIGIILDARLRADVRGPSGSLFEYGVQAAAALADSLLAQGNRVGLLIYGNAIEWTLPGYGKVQRERILRALAKSEPADRMALETLDAIPARLFPVRSQLLLISPLLPDDQGPLVRLRARGYELVVISPDPISFERAALGESRTVEVAARLAQLERELLLTRLSYAGIPAVSWNVETSFQIAALQALGRRPAV